MKNCKCRKRFVNKLIDECTETINETILVKINSTKCRHISCTVHTVLFCIFFTISAGIGAYFAYYEYMNRNKKNVFKYYYYVYQTTS